MIAKPRFARQRAVDNMAFEIDKSYRQAKRELKIHVGAYMQRRNYRSKEFIQNLTGGKFMTLKIEVKDEYGVPVKEAARKKEFMESLHDFDAVVHRIVIKERIKTGILILSLVLIDLAAIKYIFA